MSGLSLGTRASNLKSVALTVLELLAFNAQKFRGSRDRGHAPFLEKFSGVMSGLSLGTRAPKVPNFGGFRDRRRLRHSASKLVWGCGLQVHSGKKV